MSKKFRRFYETAFDSKISKSDEDLLSAEKQDSAIAHRLSNQLQLSASANSIRQYDDEDDDDATTAATANVVRASTSCRMQCKNRLLRFLLRKRRSGSGRSGGGGGGSGGGGSRQFNNVYKYRSSDSVVTSSSLSLESITSDSLSSHSSESPCYKRFPAPHVLSPISDKSSQDTGAEFLEYERRRSSTASSATPIVVAGSNVLESATAMATPVKTKPPQSLGLIKLNSDHMQHHGSDSGISVGSKPGDSYQELLDVPFDMPKLRRRQRSEEGSTTVSSSDCTRHSVLAPPQLQGLPFDMPKLRRRQTNTECGPGGAVLPFDIPKLRKRQMDSCARVISLDFEIGSDEYTYSAHSGVSHAADRSKSEQLEELPFDIPKLKKINLHNENEKKPDRSTLFLNVIPNNSAAVNENNKLLSKTFQNKNQPNRPTLSLSSIKPLNYVEDIDVSLPLDQQCWYHGPMNRLEAEKALHGQEEGTYLVRGNKGSYALSIKSAKGFIHMRITQSGERNYLGQSDRPFVTIPDLIKHYTLNKLPAKGAEHVGLIRPLAHQIQML
uniref:SH2 domain-containing adapter protein F n=1 Tax=Schizaphis graminum TaxID=13262 RepID=A0A2S2NBA5_SCHGA